MPVTTEFRVEGIAQAIHAIQQYYQTLKEGIGINRELAQAYQQSKTLVYEQRRALYMLQSTYRLQTARLTEVLRTLNTLGAIGRQTSIMWFVHNLYQMRVERSSRDLAHAQKEVAKWQDLVNQYLRDFGEESAYYLDALERLKEAQQRLKEAQASAAQAQQEAIVGYGTMALSALSVVSAMVSVRQQIGYLSMLLKTQAAPALQATTTALGTAGLAGATTQASTALSGLLSTLSTVLPIIAVIAYFLGGAYLHWNEITQLWQQRIPPAIDELNRALGSLGEELGVQLDLWTVLKIVTEPVKYFFYGLIAIVDLLIKSFTGWVYIIRDAHKAFMGFGYWLHDVLDPILARIAGFLKAIWEFLEKIGGATQGFVAGIAQAFGAETTGGIGIQGWKQIGGIIPYTGLYVLHAGEQVIPEVKARGTVGIRDVTINQYIGSISSELDLTRAGDIMYKQLMKRLEAKW